MTVVKSTVEHIDSKSLRVQLDWNLVTVQAIWRTVSFIKPCSELLCCVDIGGVTNNFVTEASAICGPLRNPQSHVDLLLLLLLLIENQGWLGLHSIFIHIKRIWKHMHLYNISWSVKKLSRTSEICSAWSAWIIHWSWKGLWITHEHDAYAVSNTFMQPVVALLPSRTVVLESQKNLPFLWTHATRHLWFKYTSQKPVKLLARNGHLL